MSGFGELPCLPWFDAAVVSGTHPVACKDKHAQSKGAEALLPLPDNILPIYTHKPPHGNIKRQDHAQRSRDCQKPTVNFLQSSHRPSDMYNSSTHHPLPPYPTPSFHALLAWLLEPRICDTRDRIVSRAGHLRGRETGDCAQVGCDWLRSWGGKEYVDRVKPIRRREVQ